MKQQKKVDYVRLFEMAKKVPRATRNFVLQATMPDGVVHWFMGIGTLPGTTGLIRDDGKPSPPVLTNLTSPYLIDAIRFDKKLAVLVNERLLTDAAGFKVVHYETAYKHWEKHPYTAEMYHKSIAEQKKVTDLPATHIDANGEAYEPGT